MTDARTRNSLRVAIGQLAFSDARERREKSAPSLVELGGRKAGVDGAEGEKEGQQPQR